MHDYEPHPAAALFPVLGEDELQKLADDIRAHGLLEPIVLHEGKVLDGRNRLEACKRAGVEPKFMVDGRIASPILYVLSKNLYRRHLTTSERAAIAAEVTVLLRNEPQLTVEAAQPKTAARKRTGTREIAARALKLSHDTVQKALDIKNAAPEEFERLKRGEITVGAAHRKLPPRPRRRRHPIDTRLDQIRCLAGDGHRASQIAAKIGLTEERVRLLARKHDIRLPDHVIGRPRKIDVNRIVRETVIGAQGLVAGLDLVEGSLDKLDRAQVPSWVSSLAESMKALNKLLKQLKEVTK